MLSSNLSVAYSLTSTELSRLIFTSKRSQS